MVQANCRIHHKYGDDRTLPSLKIRLRVNESKEEEEWMAAPGNGQSRQSVSTRVIVLPPNNKYQRIFDNVPKYRLEVLDAGGNPAQKVEMGEKGFLEIRRINDIRMKDENGENGENGEQMVINDLKAVDSEGKWIQLIDQNGFILFINIQLIQKKMHCQSGHCPFNQPN
jgi:hypothetical protein